MASPWALENFLAYGTLSIRLDTDSFAHFHQELEVSAGAEDDWRSFSADSIRKHLSSQEDHAMIMELEFLVAQKFISVSFLLVDDNIIFRIYLIPYDLPRVQGQLRVRKDEILTPARRLLKGLLLKISRSAQSWEGCCLPESPLPAPATTLSEIYEDLPSPEGLITVNSTPVTRRLLDFSDNLENLGVISTLHRYQRRSVAAMVQKEMDLTDDLDPLYLALKDMNGKPFFFQPGTTEVLLERPLVAPCRGGILCEELGTGKTVMVLGLILATRHQLSDPAPSIMDTRPVLTPLAFRHFPSDEYAAARTGLFLKNKANKRTAPRVPSLVEILLHKMATNPVAFVSEAQTDRYAKLKEAVDNLEHYAGPRMDNLPFYLDYQEDPMDNERENKRGRSRQTRGPRMLYLTSATLVVVPENLLLQWEQECSLHCEDSLRILVLRRGDLIPSARVLASEYDIILMSYSCFTGENKPNENRETWRACTCAEYVAVRVPKCECKPPACSPLLQVRWKRLVIDEGHVSASLTTVLTPFTKLLSVERRWIVTGTPTTNLLGLSLGKKVNDVFVPSEASELGSRAPSEGPEVVGQTDDVPTQGATRVWTKDDGEDLTKLGKMIAHFVGVPQLLANPQLMNTHVKEALLDRRGPRPGAMEVLMQFMSSVMIRHRISEVEEEIKLPPATQELVVLDLEPLMIKSYNALQAVIAVNAISSERKDQDYLFHRENRAFLQETVQNMGQILFWRTDDNYYNADELIRNSENLMNKLPARTSPEDVALINNAFHHIRVAGGDPLWRALQSHEDVPFLIYNLSQTTFQAWTRIGPPVESHDPQLCGYIHPDRLRGLRNLVLGQPLISEGSLIEAGAYVAEQDAKQRAAYQEHLKRKKGSKTSSSRGHEESASRLKATQAAKKAADPNTVREMQQELAVHIGADPGISVPQPHDRGRGQVRVPSVLVSKSHLATTRLGSSGSSKLNFIIDEVMKYSATEKILIFSNSELSLAHISEALDLIGVDFLRFSTQIPARVRQQFVLTFETSEKYRVFLMDLKHGARGLNLVSASRVIFCEPVWQADVESQAIKRCHRIGQTRPITVKTLAIRGTAEENMAIRRIDLKDSPEKVPKNFIDDDDNGGMRSFIANPKFITDAPTILPIVKFPLIKTLPVDKEDAVMPDVEDEPLARSIRFAADDSPSSSSKRPRDSSEDEASPPKRQVRLILPDPSSSSPSKSPKPKARVRFA
ncbi:P-loop containing nucleoside triphosphate hydrolase protein [Mycena alexandri]|uniref:P-loop containing nucleoside triphosphate hydrolase protein n=1 Tax=Mycena alexandri TaxID=1745969 RepID=A0AAD6SPD7_9AGAR|nr:P-loop containing nucleoside triphosphate hydrolase protein [Mycena alexandri]